MYSVPIPVPVPAPVPIRVVAPTPVAVAPRAPIPLLPSPLAPMPVLAVAASARAPAPSVPLPIPMPVPVPGASPPVAALVSTTAPTFVVPPVPALAVRPVPTPLGSTPASPMRVPVTIPLPSPVTTPFGTPAPSPYIPSSPQLMLPTQIYVQSPHSASGGAPIISSPFVVTNTSSNTVAGSTSTLHSAPLPGWQHAPTPHPVPVQAQPSDATTVATATAVMTAPQVPPLFPPTAGQDTAALPASPPLPETAACAAVHPSVDYSAFVSPRAPFPAREAVTVAPLGFTVPPPSILASVPGLDLDAEASGAVPTPLPPLAVVFGGAKYSSGAFEQCPRPAHAPATQEGHIDPYADWRRLQFMVDQLAVAKNYLLLENAKVSKAYSSLTSAHAPPVPRGGASSPTAAEGGGEAQTGDSGPIDLAKANLCTVAYCGSPRQLQASLKRLKGTDSIHSSGFVSLGRRQWGIKRHGEEYQLGLGMKATALQFAAVAGRLDNVVVLLAHGARNGAEPTLKALLPPDTYQLVTSATTTATRPKRHAQRRPESQSPEPQLAPAEAVVPIAEVAPVPAVQAEEILIPVSLPSVAQVVIPLVMPPPFAPAPTVPYFSNISAQPVQYSF